MASNEKEVGLQWNRQCQLIVGGHGSGLDLSELDIKFTIEKGDIETPNTADITVFNLAPETISRIAGEFNQVVLSAGYEGNVGVIFSGAIRQVRSGREGADTWLDITCADGDQAYNFATVNQTLAKGAKPADQVQAAAAAMEKHGVSTGHMTELSEQGLPRGKVMYGMARKYMRDAAQQNDTDWSIQDGKLQMVSNRSHLPGAAVVLTRDTGLIGAPEQTNEGIKVRALINPQFRIGSVIKLDNASIKTARVELAYGAVNMLPKIDRDGLYRVLRFGMSGYTRGNDWYTDMLCIGIDDTTHLPLDKV
jgi:hypothetical protein